MFNLKKTVDCVFFDHKDILNVSLKKKKFQNDRLMKGSSWEERKRYKKKKSFAAFRFGVCDAGEIMGPFLLK